ncbi:MAG: hypothetical protein J6T10_20310 [Methanobrevibacter sp.]|nr:hypothetical protein [Methanobrevibacter sp.]
MKTKAELEKEVVDLWNKNNELLNRLNHKYDRMKLAGLYLQCMKLLPDYSKKLNIMQQLDFDRVLNILDQDEFPEGF